MAISETSIIYPNVDIGENVIIEDYVIIGKPVKDGTKNKKVTIGDNCIIRSHTVIYEGNNIGDNFQTGHHVNIREDNCIGDDVSIGTSSCIEHHTVIKDNVRIHSQVFIPEYTTLEESCWIGPNVVITNAKYPLSNDVKKNLKGAFVCTNAIIGANSTILPGIVIEKNALVGAGSVVTHDIKSGQVVVGNPAREINTIDNIENYK
ncbi:hypothetical protein K8M07_02280 [Schnuerera sp. xch1]|uniref:acyltransferase n=1 Tax=Schnuerera sp. xch1 TaxID=2874283 RepID=UPI001CBBBD9F|nr:acyltransferase [Schnuerera sp. xch1]MBZ2174083.1 hypothetical protein [Schnuerera sp. xch1]